MVLACFIFPTRNCRAEILDSVDNFAILCLDIVWCYLCLENVSELPDAGTLFLSQQWKLSLNEGYFCFQSPKRLKKLL